MAGTGAMGPVGTAGREPGAKAIGPFEAALGPAAFARLAPELRAFHACGTGLWGFAGTVEIKSPSPVGRVFGSMVGAPLKAYKGAFGFELKREGRGDETWTRRFPGQLMVSKLDFVGGLVLERLGDQWKNTAGFELVEQDGALSMRIKSMVCGLTCPSWALPRVVATERGEKGWLHFEMEARALGLGRACSYKGKIDVRKLMAEIAARPERG